MRLLRMGLSVRRSTWIGVAALLFWGAHVAYVVFEHLGGDARGLLLLGTAHVHPAAMDGAPRVDGLGYDGQFYAALATDPFFSRPETAATMDSARYRGGRVGFPLLAWILAAGQDRAAVLVYQLLCWLGAGLLPWVLARWLEDEGASPLWAAPATLFAGVLSSMYASLPDAAVITICLAAALRYAHRRRGVVPLLVLAALSKETTLFLAVPIAVAALRDGRRRTAALIALVPPAFVGAWRAWLSWRLAGQPGGDGSDNFGWPFAWLPDKLARPLDVSEVASLVALAVAVSAAAVLLTRLRCWRVPELCFAVSVLVALVLSEHVYIPNWFNHSRVLLAIPVLAVVAGERLGGRWQRWTFRLAPLLWTIPSVLLLGAWTAAYAAVLAAAWWLSRRPGVRQAEAVTTPA